MKLEEIKFCNIGSFGNKVQTITYNNDGKLILLSGRSGAGKSTILNLPCLLFYGKVDRTAKTEVANRVNRNGWLRGKIKSNNSEYVIERKFSPNGVTVFKDGVDIQAVGTTDAQDYINRNIIRVPYQIFNNIICLSMNKFKSFLNMSAADRREIIDRVFNLEQINDIATLIKKDLKALGLTVNSDNAKSFTLNNTISKANSELVRLSNEGNNGNNDKVKENNRLIEEYNANVQDFATKGKQIAALYSNVYSEYQKYMGLIEKLKLSQTAYKQKLDLFSRDKCPTCGTSFDSEAFADVKKKLQQGAQTIDASLSSTSGSAQLLYDKLLKIKQANDVINENINKLNANISTLRTEVTVIQKSVQMNAEYQSIQNIINESTDQLKVVSDDLDKANAKIEELNVLSLLYSVDGVKKEVLKSYLPQLNAEIQKSLLQLDFPYQLTFNENFDSQLTDLNEPISADSLSEGEHKRVDLAVLCSIFKLLKRKYPSINIFTLDEVLSSLDTNTASAMLKFIKDFGKEMKLNVFVVTHVEMEADLFDEQIKVSKETGFSDFVSY